MCYIRQQSGLWTLFNADGVVIAVSPHRGMMYQKAFELDLRVMMLN